MIFYYSLVYEIIIGKVLDEKTLRSLIGCHWRTRIFAVHSEKWNWKRPYWKGKVIFWEPRYEYKEVVYWIAFENLKRRWCVKYRISLEIS